MTTTDDTTTTTTPNGATTMNTTTTTPDEFDPRDVTTWAQSDREAVSAAVLARCARDLAPALALRSGDDPAMEWAADVLACVPYAVARVGLPTCADDTEHLVALAVTRAKGARLDAAKRDARTVADCELTTDDAAPVMWRQSVPMPDAFAVARPLDALDIVAANLTTRAAHRGAVGSRVSADDVRVFLDACAAYEAWTVADGDVKRPTLATVLNQRDGVASSSAAGKATSRTVERVRAAIASDAELRATVFDLLTRVEHGHNETHTPAHNPDGVHAPNSVARVRKNLARRVRVTFTDDDGARVWGWVRDVHDGSEAAFIAAPDARKVRALGNPWADTDARISGDHAHDALAANAGAPVASGKVPVSPRKRSRGTTGPTVPATF